MTFAHFSEATAHLLNKVSWEVTSQLQPGPVLVGWLCHSEVRKKGRQMTALIRGGFLATGMGISLQMVFCLACSLLCTVWISWQHFKNKEIAHKYMISGFSRKIIKAGYPRSTFSGNKQLLFGQGKCSLGGYRLLCLWCSWLGGLSSDMFHWPGIVFLHFPTSLIPMIWH